MTIEHLKEHIAREEVRSSAAILGALVTWMKLFGSPIERAIGTAIDDVMSELRLEMLRKKGLN